jgi:hypothetical protein
MALDKGCCLGKFVVGDLSPTVLSYIRQVRSRRFIAYSFDLG